MRMPKMQWLTKVGDGTWWCTSVLDVGIIPSYHMPSGPYKAILENWYRVLLAYQDMQQQPALLTITYAQSLQYWAEKHNPPGNPDFHPLAESVRELWHTVQEFVTISHWDVMQGLEVESPETTHPQSKTIIFSQVLSMPVDEQETAEAPSHSISPSCWGGGHMVHLPTPLGQAEWQVYAGCYLFSGPIEPGTRWQQC